MGFYAYIMHLLQRKHIMVYCPKCNWCQSRFGYELLLNKDCEHCSFPFKKIQKLLKLDI